MGSVVAEYALRGRPTLLVRELNLDVMELSGGYIDHDKNRAFLDRLLQKLIELSVTGTRSSPHCVDDTRMLRHRLDEWNLFKSWECLRHSKGATSNRHGGNSKHRFSKVEVWWE